MKKNLIVYTLFIVVIITAMSCSVENLDLDTNTETATVENPVLNSEYPIPYDISIGYWDIEDMQGQSDEVLRYIEDRFNINITPVSVSWSNYIERYLIWASIGKLPNVFSANVTQSSTYWTWARQGIIRALPADLQNFPKVKQTLELPDTSFLSIDGYNYAIPRTSFINEDLSFSDTGLLVRKDWMDALDIENPNNFDEFTEMLRRFVVEDPDGNGMDDTAGISVNNRYALGKWMILTLHADCNTYSWVKRDDRYVPSYMTEDFLDIISAFDYMYEIGALDNEFAIQQTDDATIKFANGKLGALEYKAAPSNLLQIANMWQELQPDKDFFDSVILLPVFPALDGNIYRNKSMSYWSESLFSAAVDDGKMERILSLYEFLLSDEGVRLTRFGLEDKDYTLAGEDIVIIRPNKGNSLGYTPIEDIYPSTEMLSSLASWGVSKWDFMINDINNATYGDDIMKMSFEYMQWIDSNTIEMDRPIEFMTLAAMGNNDFSTTRIIDDMTRIILSSQDPKEAWLAVMETYRQEGIEQMIDDMNVLAHENGLE